MDMSLKQLVPVILFLYLKNLSSGHSCGIIIPESPSVELNTEFTATCILFDHCKLQFKTSFAKDIFWKFKQHRVPREQYRRINDSAVSVTVNYTSELENPLTCNVLLYSQLEQNIYGIFIKSGFSPEKPSNLTCILYQDNMELSDSISCSWTSGRPTLMPTVYTLKAETSFNAFRNQTNSNSCELKMVTVPIFVNMVFSVEASNVLGIAVSDVLVSDPVYLVKPSPPVIKKFIAENDFPNYLMVQWEHPLPSYIMLFKYNIRYRPKDTDVWTEIPENDTSSYIQTFSLQDLSADTKYGVSVRCMNSEGKGYWSDWSKEAFQITPEAKPSKKLDIWRVIGPADASGKRIIEAVWKTLPHFSANGVIKVYNVQVESLKTKDFFSYNVTNTTERLHLSEKEPYRITIVAYNSKGKSPDARIVIPESNNNTESSPVESIVPNSLDGQMHVKWKANTARVTYFVVDWCVVSEKGCSLVSWQYENKSSLQTILKGDFKPGIRYRISVCPVYKDISKPCFAEEQYFQENCPKVGPSIIKSKREKNSVELEWELISVDKLNGFIKNYTVFYKAAEENENSITVEPQDRKVTLNSLSSNTMYIVHVMASTSAGGTNGSQFTFTTLKYAPGEIEAIVVPVCLCFIFIVVIGMLFCFNKREMIKKHVWPQVPDPWNSTIANWLPNSPSQSNVSPKEPVCPEGSITNFSVIEIGLCDSKSFTDEYNKDSLKKGKYTSDEHSSGIGGSSCMSSPRQSVSDSDEGDSAQTTSSTVQYSTVVPSNYRGQGHLPSSTVFSRSESTQPLLDSEERPEDQHSYGNINTENGEHLPQSIDQDTRKQKGSYFKRPKPINEDSLLKLHQIEIAGQSSDSFKFCSTEDGGLPSSNDSDALHVDSSTSPGMHMDLESSEKMSYMPQLSGYRPQ
ncbi:interleukin-6 receptor subunit beta-like [Erpetoichthys calabaricus]|uniref:Interleukin 6 cytokine family signal transducer n=1 Tax=Erpetoichthys calabaricus TaxID=27687 RepID=A0A8C4S5P4_ERPCA|nr:interleukin-6 receptor subunit beta-like [Erpetoichthys calabaricus]